MYFSVKFVFSFFHPPPRNLYIHKVVHFAKRFLLQVWKIQQRCVNMLANLFHAPIGLGEEVSTDVCCGYHLHSILGLLLLHT